MGLGGQWRLGLGGQGRLGLGGQSGSGKGELVWLEFCLYNHELEGDWGILRQLTVVFIIWPK